MGVNRFANSPVGCYDPSWIEVDKVESAVTRFFSWRLKWIAGTRSLAPTRPLRVQSVWF
jgi:hypothetical protein